MTKKRGSSHTITKENDHSDVGNQYSDVLKFRGVLPAPNQYQKVQISYDRMFNNGMPANFKFDIYTQQMSTPKKDSCKRSFDHTKRLVDDIMSDGSNCTLTMTTRVAKKGNQST